MEDEEIVKQVQDGKRYMFDQLVVRYNKQIYSVCKRYLKNEQDAEEATQDTFVRAWKGIDSFRSDSKFYSWLYRIAINVSKRYLENRKRKIETTDEDVDEQLSDDTPELSVHSEEMSDRVSNTIENLSDKHAAVFKLKYEDELTYEEIASQLSIPIGTVRSRLSRVKHLIEQATKL